MKTAVVIPSIRQDCIMRFLSEWQQEFGDCAVMVIEDNPVKSFTLPAHVQHFSHAEIDADLGERAWIIPRKTDCVRSYGYLQAYRQGAEIIVTLDDDVLPDDKVGLIAKHVRNLSENRREDAWVSTISGPKPRGYPYRNCHREWPTMLSHGLWSGVADYDAVTQISQLRTGPAEHRPLYQTMPAGKYFPMCGMNLAWRRELTPAMHFGLQGPAYPFDRLGDIWCGVLAKRICDHMRWGVWSGDPVVLHERASNVWANLRKEAAGMEVNETFWREIDTAVLAGETAGECYTELSLTIEGIGGIHAEYWKKLRTAMGLWVDLLEAA